MDTGLEARRRLKETITACMQLLESSLGRRMVEQYGVDSEGREAERAGQDRHAPEVVSFQHELVIRLEHLQSAGLSRPEAAEQLLRDLAATHLLRLIAFRMLEVRDLIMPSIAKGTQSEGFRRWLADRPAEEAQYLGDDAAGAYEKFLVELGATLAPGLKLLFDPADPASRLFPEPHVLNQVLDRLNDPALAPVFARDRALGWCYESFRSVDQQMTAKSESSMPQSAGPQALRDRFSTRRSMVRFLVDNTLGRMWYEMRGGKTALADYCRYMVRYPDEVFLADLTSFVGNEEVFERMAAYLSGRRTEYPDLFFLALSNHWFDWGGSPEIGGQEQLLDDLEAGRRGAEDLGPLSTRYLWEILFTAARATKFNDCWDDREPALKIVGQEIHRRLMAGRAGIRIGPTVIPHRRAKNPRDLRLIDPACGSGHFLLYAFDLLLTIYREAYHDRDAVAPWEHLDINPGRGYRDQAAFEAAIPGRIAINL